jgi:hydrogenase maturation protein HypF
MGEAPSSGVRSRRIHLRGHVQGVGFRPFVYRLAHEFGITGWVQNQLGEVEVLAQGDETTLDRFEQALLDRAPPLSRPRLAGSRHCLEPAEDRFLIVDSAVTSEARIHVPPDFFTCDDCVRELNDPSDRRYRYPFINCTQCGPRYTLIRSMPYDRPNTSMADFPLCEECLAEYEEPADRRFHAEPVACPECGPSLSWRDEVREICGNEAALSACLEALADGKIVAVKGVGGYHLMCDAASDDAIGRLRAAKPRPHKPLAVMYPVRGEDGLEVLRHDVELSDEAVSRLTSPARPIVLFSKRDENGLSPLVAPGLGEIGVMLPYSPLHHLLLSAFGAPLVATSGNISGEPVLTDQDEVERRLSGTVDACLHHDRPIVRPADDSVYRPIAGRTMPIRLGRGAAPLEMRLRQSLLRPVLAVGGHMKNTVALGWDDRLVVSPHIGDMGTARSVAVFERVVEDLQDLYGVTAEAVVADAHPDYATSRWARQSGLPVTTVAHHHAHASAIARDWPDGDIGIVFAWDGVGLGTDGTLWGGETLVGRPGRWRRVGTMRSFRLPGGDRAGRDPWRSAAALCWETGIEWHPATETDWALARHAWEREINCPTSTAVGRIFDAAAALTGLVECGSFEGQGPMRLEAAAHGVDAPAVILPLGLEDGMWVTDWSPLLAMLRDASEPVGQRAAAFHASMARALVEQASRIRDETRVEHIALTGGVFQNRRLTELACRALADAGLPPRLDEDLPVNDGGLSACQIVQYAALTARSQGA